MLKSSFPPRRDGSMYSTKTKETTLHVGPIRQWAAKVEKEFTPPGSIPPERITSSKAAQWLLRGSVDNTFLNWTRNGLMSSLLGTTLFLNDPSSPASKAVFVVGLICFSNGTLGYVYATIRLYKHMGLSVFSASTNFGIAITQLCAWFTSVCYLFSLDKKDVKEISLTDMLKLTHPNKDNRLE
eukprot:CFRG1864T1